MKIALLLCIFGISYSSTANPCDDLQDAARNSDVHAINLSFVPCYLTGALHFGWTALHEAANNSQLPAMKRLVELGMDVNAADGNGWTPLHIAAAKGFIEGVRLLVEKNAEKILSASGEYAWQMAKAAKHPEVVRLLLVR